MLQRKLAALLAAGGPGAAALTAELDDLAATCSSSRGAHDQWPRPRHPALGGGASSMAATAGSMAGADGADGGEMGLLRGALADAEGAVAALQQRLVDETAAAALSAQRLSDLQVR